MILFLCENLKKKRSRCLDDGSKTFTRNKQREESFFSAAGNGIMKSNGNDDKYNNSGARGVLANIR